MAQYLGIEFGSTRIKAVAINEAHKPVSTGDYTWACHWENGFWSYDLGEALTGLKQALREIKDRDTVAAMGISGMMHGYLAFDKDWKLLTPFRTWQNIATEQAATELTALFGHNIPFRWSIAHLYQAILSGETHIFQIAHITTLAGYISYLLTGNHAVGIGEASGIFPIDNEKLCYNETMLEQFDKLVTSYHLPWKLRELLPEVLVAGQSAGTLTEAGSSLLDGLLSPGIPFAPAEGDACTGMTATNAVAPRTGNISAGTSIFAMVVLEKPMLRPYPEICPLCTPTGKAVAMVHGSNCTNDSNAWVSVLGETAKLFGADPTTGELYTKLYEKSLEGEADCGGILVCNYITGEGVTHIDSGRPLVVRRPDSRFTLANFFRSTLYSTMATLRLGLDILAREGIVIDSITGHGGLFKTPVVGQKYLAAACNAPITCSATAAEGGPYGMALLAAFLLRKEPEETLEDYLNTHVFAQIESTTLAPDPADVAGFNRYMESYTQLLRVEKTAVDLI